MQNDAYNQHIETPFYNGVEKYELKDTSNPLSHHAITSSNIFIFKEALAPEICKYIIQ